MSDNELVAYPGGQVAFGNSELQHVASAKFNLKNGAKLQHTLRRSPAGVTVGNRDLSGTLETMIPADGIEHDYLGKVLAGESGRFRFKVPGSVYVIDGVFEGADVDMSAGEAVKVSVSFVGALRMDN